MPSWLLGPSGRRCRRVGCLPSFCYSRLSSRAGALISWDLRWSQLLGSCRTSASLILYLGLDDVQALLRLSREVFAIFRQILDNFHCQQRPFAARLLLLMASAAPVSEGGEAAGAFLDSGVWNLLDDGLGDQFPEAPAYVDDLRLSEASDPPFGWDDPYGSAEERDWYSQVQDNDLGSFECVDDEQSKVLVLSAPSSSVSGEVSWLQGRPAEEDAAQQVQAAENKRRRLSLAKQPWDSTPSHLSRSFDFFFKGLPSVGVRESLTLTHEEDPAPDFDQIPWTVTRRLAKARVPKSDADIRDSALKRLKMLILLDPEATSLGCSLVEQGKALSPDEDIMQSLSDAFRPKASLTLQKRSLSLQVYVVRSYEASLASPWRLSEEQMYQVIASFRREGSKASTASHILEALRFLQCDCALQVHQLGGKSCPLGYEGWLRT